MHRQLLELRARLGRASIAREFRQVLVIGSVSRGEATYRSDVDLLVILRQGPLNYARVQDLRRRLEEEVISGSEGLEVQAQFVLPGVHQTTEPAMRQALREAWPLISAPEAA